VETPVPSSLGPFVGYTNWEIVPTYNAAMSYSTEDGYMHHLVWIHFLESPTLPLLVEEIPRLVKSSALC
jgi:hypothetical protein